jgi:tetratricopeptide (TPR) repeat protein
MSTKLLGVLRRLAGLAALLAAQAASAAPYIPTAADTVLERVAPGNDPAEAELHRLTVELAGDRSNRALAVQVARLNIARGQLLADSRYFGRADAALAPWIDEADPPTDVRLLRGILRQANHDFDGALDDLGVVLEAEPRNGQARLTRAVVRMVRAEYPAAQDDCGQLVGAAPASALDVCVAAVASITGHARPALVMLAITAAAADTPQPIRVWALTLEGETDTRLGDSKAAFAAFEQARRLAPDDSYLLAACADTLMDSGHPDEVLDLLDSRTRIDTLLLRLTEAEQLLGRPDSDHISQLASRFETSSRRGEIIHQREAARFTLHILGRPDEALRLAQANWRVQREPADARILLEAAIAAGAPAAAAPVLAWSRDNGVEDTQFASLAKRIDEAAP